MKAKKKIIIILSAIALIIIAIIGVRAFIANKIQKAIAASKNAPVNIIATKVKSYNFYDEVDTFGTALANQTFSIRIKKDNLADSIDFDKYPSVNKDSIIANLKDGEVIIAPFSGKVGKREITPGILGGENSIIATLDDIKILKVDVKLPEKYLSIVKKGLRVEATTGAFPGIYKGTIENISSRIDPTTRSILVQAKIQNPQENLIPGILLNTKIIFNEKKSLGVPEEALLIQGSDKYIFVIIDNTAQQKKVEIGRRNEGRVEIVSGLTEGETILAEGTNKIRNKGKVKIVKTVE